MVLQPASRRAARHTSTSALKRFFAIADAWELSPLQQCRLLKIPSPQVLERYRMGQAPRLSASQQERAALIVVNHTFADDVSGLEVLCTKGGKGSLSIDGREIGAKEAKKLPASD